jgi:FkbM family methyltransferase
MLNLRWMRKNFARWVPERLKSRFRARLFGYGSRTVDVGTLSPPDGDEVEAVFGDVRLRAPAVAHEDLRYHLVDNADSIDEMDALLRVARTAGGLLVDVGAARGILSAMFCLARDGNRAVAFEPAPAQARDAANLAGMNGLDDRMQVRPAAVGAASRVLQAAVDAMGLIDFSIPAGADTFEVEMTTLDDEVRRTGTVPDIVKIDVEGFEGDVLLGAQALLRDHKPLLFLEMHLDLLERRGVDSNAIVRMLEGFGYRFERCDGRPLDARAVSASPNAVLRLVAR